MPDELRTQVFSTFSDDEKEALKQFKTDVFYIVGAHVPDAVFWQEFFNLFFIYHIRLEDGKSFAQRRNMKPARLALYTPSLFFLHRGTLFPSGERIVWDVEDEDGSSAWYSGRDYLLSFFYQEDNAISLVNSKIAQMFSRKHSKFLRTIKKLVNADSAPLSDIAVLFLVALLLLKKDRYQESPLYDPFRVEEFEKLRLHYAELIKRLI